MQRLQRLIHIPFRYMSRTQWVLYISRTWEALPRPSQGYATHSAPDTHSIQIYVTNSMSPLHITNLRSPSSPITRVLNASSAWYTFHWDIRHELNKSSTYHELCASCRYCELNESWTHHNLNKSSIQHQLTESPTYHELYALYTHHELNESWTHHNLNKSSK